MNKRFTISRIIPFLVLSGGLIMVYASIKSSSGPGPGYTNAPGESNCTSCHSGSLNPTPANLSNLKVSTSFTGGGYIPDSSYSVTVSYTQSGISKYGFEVTCLTKTGANPVGYFTAGTGSKTDSLTVLNKKRYYVQHSTGSSTGSWTFTWHAPSTNVDSVIFYVVVNATNNNGSSSSDEIYAKTFTFGPSSLLPVATINTSKPKVCVGDTVTYYGNGTENPISYRWKFQSGTPQIVTTQSVVRTYATAGNFRDTLWVTNAKGVSKPVVYNMQVLNKPVPSIQLTSANDTTCEGDTILLETPAISGGIYEWNTGNAADTFPVLKATQNGNYFVKVTNAGGCFGTSNSIAVTFLPAPMPTLQSNTTSVCEGDSIQVWAEGGYQKYDFYDDTTLVKSSTDSFVYIRNAGPHGVRVVAHNQFCEGSSLHLPLFIQPKLTAPVLTCGNKTTDEVEFTWTALAGAQGYLVSEDTGKTWIAPNGTLAHTVSGLTYNTPVLLLIKAQTTGVCSESQTGSLVCTTLPCSIFNFEIKKSDTLVCFGDSALITIGDLTLTNYTISFQGSTQTTDTAYWFKPAFVGEKFQVDILDLDNPSCPAFSLKDSVIVDSLPAITAATGPAACEGVPVALTITGNFKTYNFYRNHVLEHSGTNNSFVYPTIVNGDSVSGGGINLQCETKSAQQVVVKHPLPQHIGFTVSGNMGSYTFTDTTDLTLPANTGLTRSWDFGDNSPAQNAQQVNHSYTVNGSYNVRLYSTTTNGCVDSAAQQVNANAGILTLQHMQIRAYPNPAKEQLYVDIDQFSSPVQLSITDVNGRKIISAVLENAANRIDITSLAEGIYLVQLSVPRANVQQKLVIVK